MTCSRTATLSRLFPVPLLAMSKRVSPWCCILRSLSPFMVSSVDRNEEASAG
jgi:hypothetical protein